METTDQTHRDSAVLLGDDTRATFPRDPFRPCYNGRKMTSARNAV